MSKFSKGVITGKEVQRVFHDAKLNQYALPAVNVTNTSTVNTVLETAAELNSPVIIQFSAGGCQFYAGKGLKDDNSGDIQMKANKGVLIDAPDIRIVGSNLRLTARNEFTISAKVMGGIVAGVLQMASSADFAASIPLSKLTQLKEALEAE